MRAPNPHWFEIRDRHLLVEKWGPSLKIKRGSTNIPELLQNPFCILLGICHETKPSMCKKAKLWNMLQMAPLGFLHPTIEGIITPWPATNFPN